MKALFTDAKLYVALPDVLYLFQLCALKTSNEAVVEGMGSIMDIHASPRRNLDQENYAQEAIVHFNGPPLNLAEDVVKEALNSRFPRGWHFTSTDTSIKAHKGTLKFQVISKAIFRLKQVSAKLSFFNKPAEGRAARAASCGGVGAAAEGGAINGNGGGVEEIETEHSDRERDN
jgi:hypothetical protein